jgi:uncharacterized protein YegL
MTNEFVAPPMSYTLGANFDPNSVDQERVVLLSLCVDRSGSTAKYDQEFNDKLQEFLAAEKNSHIADELFFQIVTFGGNVTVDSGWQPVVGFDTSKRLFSNSGDTTSGFDGVRIALESMLDYGKNLQRNGTDVRYNLVVVTDGEFNEGSDRTGYTVRRILDQIRQDERLYGKFTIFMYGVGNDAEFEKTCDSLSIDRTALLRTGATGQDFKKMLATVSQSVSKSSSGTAVPNF